jgi:hypothetical protein
MAPVDYFRTSEFRARRGGAQDCLSGVTVAFGRLASPFDGGAGRLGSRDHGGQDGTTTGYGACGRPADASLSTRAAGRAQPGADRGPRPLRRRSVGPNRGRADLRHRPEDAGSRTRTFEGAGPAGTRVGRHSRSARPGSSRPRAGRSNCCHPDGAVRRLCFLSAR